MTQYVGSWSTTTSRRPLDADELSRIEAADELEIAPRRRDGSLRTPVPIWVVRVGDHLYVRAAYGSGSGWHATTLELAPRA